jgi:hypothetical protein
MITVESLIRDMSNQKQLYLMAQTTPPESPTKQNKELEE